MKIRTISLIVSLYFLSLSFISCKKEPTIVGLWEVESVQVGDQSMTPIARWMKFESDGSQTSGNGWLQHSFGTYTLDKNLLRVIDLNGINSIDTPFTIDIQENSMTWKREENGEEVIVNIKRIFKIPQSEGNKLLGLWKLTSSTDEGNDITAMINPDGKSMLHIRWDNMYVQHNMPKGKGYGTYRIHAHKPEIQLVNFGPDSNFSFWKFSIDNNQLTLESTDQKSVMIFERIDNYL